jgi:hypothetical protein
MQARCCVVQASCKHVLTGWHADRLLAKHQQAPATRHTKAARQQVLRQVLWLTQADWGHAGKMLCGTSQLQTRADRLLAKHQQAPATRHTKAARQQVLRQVLWLTQADWGHAGKMLCGTRQLQTRADRLLANTCTGVASGWWPGRHTPPDVVGPCRMVARTPHAPRCRWRSNAEHLQAQPQQAQQVGVRQVPIATMPHSHALLPQPAPRRRWSMQSTCSHRQQARHVLRQLRPLCCVRGLLERVHACTNSKTECRQACASPAGASGWWPGRHTPPNVVGPCMMVAKVVQERQLAMWCLQPALPERQMPSAVVCRRPRVRQAGAASAIARTPKCPAPRRRWNTCSSQERGCSRRVHSRRVDGGMELDG